MSDNQETKQSSPQQTISFTRHRTTTKTRTAASTARRRKNIPLVQAAGCGEGPDNNADGKDRYSWFARKSAGWTDEEIKRHLTSGGMSNGGGSGVSYVGDVIVGGSDPNGKKKEKRRRRNVPMFDWEQEDQIDSKAHLGMKAAPTIFDIMDEQDKVDFMAPVQVGEKFQSNPTGSETHGADTLSKRQIRTNAALAELAQVSGQSRNFGEGAPTSANESVGWRLLKVWGYRQRLGFAIVPLRGKDIDTDAINHLLESDDQNSTSFETKWLARKGLRVIRLPSIKSDSKDNTANRPPEHLLNLKSDHDIVGENETLAIPPPKLNKYGIEYDPFRNAPEFRAFHERRRARALERGRAIEEESDSKNSDRETIGRYFTNSLRKDARPGDRWDSLVCIDKSDRVTDEQRSTAKAKSQNSHYAAEDNNFADFIGTKASSGFALEDEDDANVYQDDEHDLVRVRKDRMISAESSNYALEVQSPMVSENEDDGDLGGPFNLSASSAGGILNKKAGRKNQLAKNDGKGPRENHEALEDAWSRWGNMGSIDKKTENTASATLGPGRLKTYDGKPPLPGFRLGHAKELMKSAKRWKGPFLPSGFVLKRHVFLPSDQSSKTVAIDRLDSALGLDLSSNRATIGRVPQVLPPLRYARDADRTSSLDQKQLNFDSVKASMKNRFVPSSGETMNKSPETSTDYDRDENAKDKEEWVPATFITWLPSRLLCKRWGLPFPSSVNAAINEDTGESGRKGEDVYFRETVLEPAVVVDRINRESKTLPNGEKKKSPKSPGPCDIEPNGADDNATPLPNRPSADVFRSIFDADSDSSLFSSDEEDSVVDDKLGGNNETTKSSHEPEPRQIFPLISQQAHDKDDLSMVLQKRTYERSESKPPGIAEIAHSTNLAPHRDRRSPELSSTTMDYSSDEDESRRKSGKRRRRSRRNRHDDIKNFNDRDKKEKRRRSHRKRRHRRHSYSSASSYDSDSDDSKSKKKKRHEESSRSSEKRNKKRKKERRH